MTIALGFKCEDGIALASDSQYSAGLSKTRGQKIFVIPSNGHYALTVAGAGSVANMKRAVELLEGGIRDIGDRAATTEELRGKRGYRRGHLHRSRIR